MPFLTLKIYRNFSVLLHRLELGVPAASPVTLGDTSGTCTPAQGLTAFLWFLALLTPGCVSGKVPYWLEVEKRILFGSKSDCKHSRNHDWLKNKALKIILRMSHEKGKPVPGKHNERAGRCGRESRIASYVNS